MEFYGLLRTLPQICTNFLNTNYIKQKRYPIESRFIITKRETYSIYCQHSKEVKVAIVQSGYVGVVPENHGVKNINSGVVLLFFDTCSSQQA